MGPFLDGGTALVTGAGRGIGRAVARSLAAAGAHVVATARSVGQLDETVREIVDTGGSAEAAAVDITDDSAVEELFADIDRCKNPLSVLVNNAGVGIFGTVADFSMDDYDRVLRINLRATFQCCRLAMQRMIPNRAGYIINISSVTGFKGYPRQAAYTASKHGIMGLTKSLAVEAQPHEIRVSAVLPGGVDTELVGKARPDLDRSVLMQPEDIAHTVMFLLSLSPRAAVDRIYIRRRTSSPF